MGRFAVGDPVVYRKTKRSVHPGPRASHVMPETHGEGYTYLVEKFWRVRAVQDDGNVVVCTRSGKQHVVSAADHNLRKPGLIKYFLWRHKFPVAE